MSGRDFLPAVQGDAVTPIFCSSLSAPTGRIPFDVLSMVFSLLTQDDWIRVSGVCRHWRAASLGDKRLWCNITIRAAFSTAPVVHMPSTPNAAFDPNDGPPCCSLSQTSLPVSSNHRVLPVLLRRSGSLPISLDFSFSVHYDMRVVHSSIIAIEENAYRIRSLTICTEGCAAWMSMLASLPECMPLLSRIVLCISGIAPTRSHDVDDFGLRSRDRWARYQSLSHIEMNGIADDAGFGALLASAVQCPTVTTVSIGHIGITPLYLKSIFYLFPALCTIEILGCKDGAPGQWHTHPPSVTVDVPTTLTELRTGRFQTLELTRVILSILQARRLPILSVWIPLPSALQFTDVFSHLGPLYDVTIDIDEEQHDCSLASLDVAGYRRRAIIHNPFGGVPRFLDLIAPLDLSCLVSLTIPNHFWKEMLLHFGSSGLSFPALRTFCLTFIPYIRFVGVVGFMHATNSIRRMRDAPSESAVPPTPGPDCAPSTVSRASVPLRWPALRSLEFRKWRNCEEECVVPIQMLVDVAESFDFGADQQVEINIQGLAVIDSMKGLSLDDGLLRLRRLASVSKLVFGRRVY